MDEMGDNRKIQPGDYSVLDIMSEFFSWAFTPRRHHDKCKNFPAGIVPFKTLDGIKEHIYSFVMILTSSGCADQEGLVTVIVSGKSRRGLKKFLSCKCTCFVKF